jgi:hypothetical protein
MTKEERREHRQHKHERLRRAIQARGGGRPGANGLQLPKMDFSGIPGLPRVTYPQGWTPKRPGPVGAVLLYGVGIIVVIGIILAIAHIFG